MSDTILHAPRRWLVGCAAAAVLLLGGSPAALAARDTLVIAIPTDIESMDPHLSGGLSMRVWANIYETLISRGPDGKLEPRLASSWRQSDPTHIEFQIRKGVKFTSGNPVNAEVLAGVFNAKNDSASPHAHVSFSKWIKKAYAKDADTLVIETDAPFPAALFYLANVMPGSIYDLLARAEKGNLKTESAGTGPYLLDEVVPGQYVRLRRNPGYWGQAPKTEFLEFRVIPEEITRVLALKRGEVDIVLDLGPDSLSQLQDDSNITTDVYRIFRINTLEYNFLQPLIKNNEPIRDAIRLAIDTKGIADNVVGSKGDPADSVVLDVSWGHTPVPECLAFDPDEARRILDAAGWKAGAGGVREKDGERLSLRFVTDFTRDYRNREVAQAIQSFLRQVGIETDLVLLERGPFIDTVIQQKSDPYHLNIQGWGSPTNEASWWIYTRLHSANQAVGAWGTSRTQMDWLDAKIDAARVETDETKSIPLWHELQKDICDQSLMLPLYFANGVQAVRNSVSGFVTHSDEWYGYRYLDATVTD